MSLLTDVRYALRLTFRRRGFSTAAILMIAIGIAANVVIFALVNGILIDPLEFRDPDQLVIVWENDLHNDTPRGGASKPDFDDWVTRSTSFASLTAVSTRNVSLTGGDARPELIEQAFVTERFLTTLGVSPSLGRDLTDSEIRDGSNVTLISHGLWQRRFGSATDVLGKPIVVDGTTYSVAGVMPAGFSFPDEIDVWSPLVLADRFKSRGVHALTAIGRLRPAVSREHANDEMVALMAQLEKEYPEDNRGRGAFVESLHEATVEESRAALRLLAGASVALLLLVCVNVAGLMIARSTERASEVAIRQSLGASRSRVVRQLIAESAVLGILGGAIAVALAPALLEVLLRMAPANLPRLTNVTISPVVLLFAAAIAIGTGVLAGVIPAMQMSRAGRFAALLTGLRGSIRTHRGSVRHGLVVLQVALAVVLVVSSALLARSFVLLGSVDPGIRSTGVLTFNATLPDARYHTPAFDKFPDWPEAYQFYDRALEALRAVPGVQSATLAMNHPLRAGWTSRVTIEGRAVPEGPIDESRIRSVTPGYFESLGMVLERGRTIQESDRVESAAVVVVNHAFAEKYFPNEDPIGRNVVFWSKPKRIVGVVRDSRFQGLDRDPEPAVYSSLFQSPMSDLTFVVRGEVAPDSLIKPAQEAIWSVDSDLALHHVETIDETLSRSLAPRRFRTTLMVFFGLTALLLAAIGVYGLLAWQVSRRTREIGVRLAVGAEPSGVLSMVLREGLALTGIGVIVGLVAAIPATRLVQGLLFGVGRFDVPTLIVSATTIVLSATVACWIPAWRAARLNPVTALRED